MRTTGILRWGGILLGVGLGGFADGIVLHQIFQWHHMLSSVVPPTDMAAMRVNMRADGLFHIATWVVTVLGVWMMWQAGQRVTAFPSTGWFVGHFFMGWGAFNFMEGIVDHHVLGIHHVRGTPDFDWDYGFLLVAGVGFFLLGRWLVRRAPQPDHRRPFRG
jgi:uncharacterized membrane protein